jgi:hypothetical protein
MNAHSLAAVHRLVESDDLAGVAALLERHRAELAALMSSPGVSPAGILASVRSVGMADLLLENGLTAAMVGAWWAPGFGLNRLSPEVAEHLVQRGAVLTPHAASALGLVERLRGLLDRQPDLVHAKGGDGCRPLHFSRDVATARLLLERGADIDARDDDHDSTPAQWRIGDAPEVTRLLLARGAQGDLFMAAGLGDLALAERLVRQDRACTIHRIGNNRGPFPGIGSGGRGGTIYQWTLGFNQSAQEIAHRRGHRELYDFLMAHTPPRQQLLVACALADRSLAESIVARSPGLVAELDAEDHTLLAKFCWETNISIEAVRLMLDLGFPVDVPESNHGFMPLHNAAWCGDAPLVELLLRHGHPVDRRDPGYNATALGYAIHSCVTARRHPGGSFPEVVRLLLEAGVPLDPHQYPSGDPAIDAVIGSIRKARA